MSSVLFFPELPSVERRQYGDAFWRSLFYFNVYRLLAALLLLMSVAVWGTNLWFGSRDLALFVTATAEIRAQRRVRELLERGMPAHYEDVLLDIRARDERDAHRAVAPLHQAADAILLDTSDLTADEAIAEAIRLVEERLKVR